MKLSIYRCIRCGKIRLVDRVNDEWVCFACKQRVKKPVEIEEVKKETPKQATKKKATRTKRSKRKR